jgi:hypothetical protein
MPHCCHSTKHTFDVAAIVAAAAAAVPLPPPAGVEGVGQSTWAQAKAADVAEAARQPAYGSMECCSLQPGAKWVSFYTDCSRVDVMAVNYTAQALKMNPWRR